MTDANSTCICDAGDEVHVYCGLTRLVRVCFGTTGIRVTAAEGYARQEGGRPILGQWRHDPADAPAFAQRALDVP